VISELDIWRAANLLLKRYGDSARAEGTARADALAEAGNRGLAPDHASRRPTREQDPARPGPLTGCSLRDNPVCHVEALSSEGIIRSRSLLGTRGTSRDVRTLQDQVHHSRR
jgi:hypothetical protein